MQKRILTAAVGIPIVIIAILGPPIIAEFFIMVVALGAAYELLRLTDHTTLLGESLIFGTVIALIVLAALLTLNDFAVVILLAVLAAGVARWVLRQPLWSTLGILYVAVPMSLLVSLLLVEDGQKWVMVLLAGTWATDTMALFGGKQFGKTKLAPTISPNKTREGTAIGIVSGVLAIIIFGLVLGLTEYAMLAIILAAVSLPPLAVIGDLTESRIKRFYDKKDSGSLLPGHGGLLDRIDSMLFTATALWIIVLLTV